MENIGSTALVADGIEARTDGFTSLAVVTGSAASRPGAGPRSTLVGP